MRTSLIVISFLITVTAGCVKKSFLETNPSSGLSTIQTLADCQSLLNNEDVFRETPVCGEISSDNYYVSPDGWGNFTDLDRDIYYWAKYLFGGETNIADYNVPYAQVNICNEVLAALNRITITAYEKSEKQYIEGTALFLRAYAFHNLLQLFASPYESSTARQDNGIALPLMPDFNAVYYRASMEDSYKQVIEDLMKAITLLPEKVDTINKNRPAKPAAEGLLARVYLSMRDYARAEIFADSCLQHNGALLDYNSLNATKPSFPKNNEEILYFSWLISTNHFFRYIKQGKDCFVDPDLYELYDENDLRKTIFYNTTDITPPILNQNYTGRVFAFGGLATDEIILIRSECRVRNNNLQGAANDLNDLLIKRYKPNTLMRYTASTINLNIILNERRKELAFRGLRWCDLRRLNMEGANITLQRVFNGNVYELLPGDLRYTLPIPDDAIAGSRIVQNPR